MAGTRRGAHRGAREHEIPFPCLVYQRKAGTDLYEFSHYSSTVVKKTLPASLRVSDLACYSQKEYEHSLRKTPFMVLAAGEKAQAFCCDNAREVKVSFLYNGSVYARNTQPLFQYSEVQDGYVPWYPFSTLVLFKDNTPDSVLPLPSDLMLFPKKISVAGALDVAGWVEEAVAKVLRTSQWLVAGISYSERTLLPNKICTEAPANTPERGDSSRKRGAETGTGPAHRGKRQRLLAAGDGPKPRAPEHADAP